MNNFHKGISSLLGGFLIMLVTPHSSTNPPSVLGLPLYPRKHQPLPPLLLPPHLQPAPTRRLRNLLDPPHGSHHHDPHLPPGHLYLQARTQRTPPDDPRLHPRRHLSLPLLLYHQLLGLLLPLRLRLRCLQRHSCKNKSSCMNPFST